MNGWVRGQIKVCVPKIGLKFLAPLINYIFCMRHRETYGWKIVRDVEGTHVKTSGMQRSTCISGNRAGAPLERGMPQHQSNPARFPSPWRPCEGKGLCCDVHSH